MPVEAKLMIQGGKQWIIKASESTSDILMVFKGLYTSVMEWNTHWIMWPSSPFTHWFYICRRVCTYSCVCVGVLGQQALSSEIRFITETGAHTLTRQTGQWVQRADGGLSPSALPLAAPEFKALCPPLLTWELGIQTHFTGWAIYLDHIFGHFTISKFLMTLDT